MDKFYDLQRRDHFIKMEYPDISPTAVMPYELIAPSAHKKWQHGNENTYCLQGNTRRLTRRPDHKKFSNSRG